MLDGVLRFDGITKALDALDITKTDKIIVILVNAETALDVEASQHLCAPTLAAVLNAATSVPLQRYSFETVALLKRRLRQWEQDAHRITCGSDLPHNPANGDCRGVTMTFIEVNFSEHPNPNERDYLKRLPTSFRLPNEAVDRLIAAGGLILRKSEAFRRLLQELR